MNTATKQQFPKTTANKYYVRQNDSVLVRFNPLRYIPAWQVLNCFGRVVGTYDNEENADFQAYLANRMLDKQAEQQQRNVETIWGEQ